MYRFLDLLHELPDDHFNREELFARSEQMMRAGMRALDDHKVMMELLQSKLQPGDKYYVLHEQMLYKGKTAKYTGQIVMASGRDIIPFINDGLRKNDLRPMRIFPVHSPAWLLRFTDETVLCIFG